jgi:hypothetical protein
VLAWETDMFTLIQSPLEVMGDAVRLLDESQELTLESVSAEGATNWATWSSVSSGILCQQRALPRLQSGTVHSEDFREC